MEGNIHRNSSNYFCSISDVLNSVQARHPIVSLCLCLWNNRRIIIWI